ncbi:MAG: nicotinamide riboside transporter PnuC [Cytophagaceae bacterium]
MQGISLFKILEYTAALTGLMGVAFTIRRSIISWYFGFISVLIYTYIFYQSKLYSDTLLQIFYISFTVYGWYQWKYVKMENNSQTIVIRKATTQDYKKGIFFSSIFSLLLVFIFSQTDAENIYFDAILTSASLWATYWMAKKIIDHWILWIIIDSAYVILYLDKQLPVTALLYAIFVGMVIKGFIDWRKDLHA